VEVVATEDARRYLAARGGVAYVRTSRHGCCTNSMTLLETAVKPPRNAHDYLPVGSDELDVRFLGSPSAGPSTILIELRGIVRHHLVAFWDGCAFKI
jgi:hypothetical protein